MSHTQQIENTHFAYNSDLSGNVTISSGDASIEIPGADLLYFIAYWVANQKISDLEQSSPEEIFGLKRLFS